MLSRGLQQYTQRCLVEGDGVIYLQKVFKGKAVKLIEINIELNSGSTYSSFHFSRTLPLMTTKKICAEGKNSPAYSFFNAKFSDLKKMNSFTII